MTDPSAVGIALTDEQVGVLRVWHDARRLSCCASEARPCCLAMILGDAPQAPSDQEIIVAQLQGQTPESEGPVTAENERVQAMMAKLTGVHRANQGDDGQYTVFIPKGSTPLRCNDPQTGESYPVRLPFDESPIFRYTVTVEDGLAVLTPCQKPVHDPRKERRSRRHRDSPLR